MDKNEGKDAASQQQTGQTQFQCTGDCMKCHSAQWNYCASQHSYRAMRLVIAMQDALNVLIGEVGMLKAKITAMQESEGLVFKPDVEEKSGNPTLPIAQSGDGAGE